MMPSPPGTAPNFTNLLTNQVNEIIIPTAETYQAGMNNLEVSVQSFVTDINESTLADLRATYLETNLAYQAAAVHNYFATANLDFVNTTNLYPVDVSLLEAFIETEAYDFNSTAQQGLMDSRHWTTCCMGLQIR